MSRSKRPELPWTELLEYAPADEPHIGFWRQYLAMWTGLQFNHEDAPLLQ